MKELMKKIKNKKWLGLSFILVIAFLVRIFPAAKLPFVYDEFYTAMAVKGVIRTGFPIMPSGFIYLRAFPLSYAMYFFVLVGGFSELSIRIFPLILGLISLVVIYRILLREMDEVWAFFGTLIVALSPWHAWYSIYARSFLFQGLLFLIIVDNYYLFLTYLKNKEKNQYRYKLYENIPWILLLGLISPIVFLSVVALAGVYFLRFEIIKQRRYVIPTLITLLVIGIVVMLPSGIPMWENSSLGNEYSILDSSRYFILNLYFFKRMAMWFPVGFPLLIFIGIYWYLKKNLMLLYPIFIFGSFVLLSFLNPFGNLQPRYLSNFTEVYYVAIFIGVFYLLRNVRINVIVKNITFYIFLGFLFVSDLYLLPAFFSIKPGIITGKTIRVSESWERLSDARSPSLYVNAKMSSGDIVISLQPRGQTEIYLKKKPDYLLRTVNYMSEGHATTAGYLDDFSLIPLITNADQFENVITQVKKSQKIWIISSKSEDPQLEHIDEKTQRILYKYGEVVFQGEDPNAKVYRITSSL